MPTLKEVMRSRNLNEIDVENLTIAKEIEHIEAVNRGEANFCSNSQIHCRMDRHRILLIRNGTYLPYREEHCILCRALCIAPEELQFEIKDPETGMLKVTKPDYQLNFPTD